MKNKTSIYFILSLLLAILITNFTVAKAQITNTGTQVTYSGYAVAATNKDGTQNADRITLPTTGGSQYFEDYKEYFNFGANGIGCVGNCDGLHPAGGGNGIILSVNGANGSSKSSATVDFLDVYFNGYQFQADWLMTYAEATCPSGNCPPLLKATSSVLWITVNGQNIQTDTVDYYKSWTLDNGTKVEINVIDKTTNGSYGEVMACAMVLTAPNGAQVRFACSHADVNCNGNPPPNCNGKCTYTQGYYKNHESVVQSILAANGGTLQLGNHSYTAAQIDAIYGTPVQGNGLISLAHQLITAKLNLLRIGASCVPDWLETKIAAADALVGNRLIPPLGGGYLHPSQTSALNDNLTDFNEGKVDGLPHCGGNDDEEDKSKPKKK